jgi:hypothetical protein
VRRVLSGKAAAMFDLTVRNPVAELNAKVTPRAPRLLTLDGAQVGLWWNKKIGGEVALEWLGAEFAGDFGARTERFYDSFPAHKGMTAKAARWADAVVGATGD